MNTFSEKRVTRAASIAGHKIVVALTAQERALFFDETIGTAASSWHFLSDAQLDPNGWSRRLARLQPTILVTGWKTPSLPARWIGQPHCPLQYVCHVTGSVRLLVPRVFIERGGVITNWGNSVSSQVAEHALLLALAALRNAAQWRAFIARPVSKRRIEQLATKTLHSRRVGVHGFGSVARALVPLLAPFAVAIEAYSAGVPPDLMRAVGVRPATSLTTLFSHSEVLFECEALTPATACSITAGVLAALPDDAVFVNVGRGGLVDDAALQREIASGRLRVALDVATDEPLTPASRYVGARNVILSPHIGGPTLDRYEECGRLALANLRSFIDGRIPAGAISLAAYDRAT